MMHEFYSHCDVRKTSLFEINQQLGDQMVRKALISAKRITAVENVAG